MIQEHYLLEMRNICKEFPGVKALEHARLLVKKGTVHALLGENGAGKSTLMKCLFGIYKKDSGTIILDGTQIEFNNPREALQNGISMVPQELDQVPELNLMDNIWLGRFPMKGIFVDERKMYQDTKEVLKELELDFNVNKKLNTFSISSRQLIDIAKAISYQFKVIVLDEPTSSLTEKEVNYLFSIIRMIKKRGISVIYISHKLEEVKEIADEVTIMRDGCTISTDSIEKITINKIIWNMVGREMTQYFPPKDNEMGGEVVLSVRNLKGLGNNTVENVTFDLHKGEILGVAGLLGSKRTELCETLFGIRNKESGEIICKGKNITNEFPRQAIKRGFAMLTEERRLLGIFPDLDIQFNSVIANIDNYRGRTGLLKGKKMSQDTNWVIENLGIKTPSQKTHIFSLSGGNQQKVILGRLLLINAEIMFLDEPTRGIDVGAKYEIYQLIISLAKQGKAIIFISSEIHELLGISDRILVMSNGHSSEIIDVRKTPQLATQEHILESAAMYL